MLLIVVDLSWLGRVRLERPDVSLADLDLASTALHALPIDRLTAL